MPFSKEIAGLLKKMKNNMLMMTQKSGDGVYEQISRGEIRVRTILSGLYITILGPMCRFWGVFKV